MSGLTWEKSVFDFGTIVIFDLEFTSWEGFLESGWSLPGRHREVLQIGAVRLDSKNGFEEQEGFSILVKPHIHPELSDYIIDLTGITQDVIDRDGRPFAEALDAFVDFIGPGPVQLCAHGADASVIRENCVWNDLDFPPAFNEVLNLEPVMRKAIGERVTSSEIPARLGLPETGAAHDALGDARALAAALRHLKAEARIQSGS